MLDPAGVLLCNVRLNLQRFHQELLNQHMAFIYFLRFFVAFEELFFNKNVKTAINVAQARGAALVAASEKTEELYEYTPLQIKQAVVGYGRADKNQVQIMVKTLLSLKEIPKPDDAADAVAVAICHAHSAHTAGILNTKIK